MKTEYIAIMIMIVLALGLLYYGFISFIKNKGLNNLQRESSIDIDQLVKALGGIENIQDVSSSPSKLTVVLKDQSLKDIASIQSLGASGIVEGKDSLSMIFGRESALVYEDIKSLM